MTLAFGLALGYALFDLAQGVAEFVDALTTHLPATGDDVISYTLTARFGGGLTWRIGHRVLTLDGILSGLIEVALVLAVAAYVRSRRAQPVT
jgi:hypothetical protein